MNNFMIGILAIQGDYEAHANILKQLNVKYTFVVSVEQLKECDGLIIPGGESSTILKFILLNGLFDEIIKFNKSGKPIFGTCAGAILLANKAINPEQKSLGLIDITIERNGYGRQLESRILMGETSLKDLSQKMAFIRAPKIIKLGKGVDIMARCDKEIVSVKQNKCIATTFHPELTSDFSWHKFFLSLV